MALTKEREATRERVKPLIVDGDIHNELPSENALLPYLPAEWHEYHRRFGLRGYPGHVYPRVNPNAARTDAWPPNGDPPGSNLPFMREQLLDKWDIEYGILNCLVNTGTRNLPYAAARASALNDWQVAEWVEPEPRLRASIVIPAEDGARAAAEIDRVGDDPSFVQVLMTVRTAEPHGRSRYWPIYEAAQRHGLPVGIHFGGHAGNPVTGVGWPSFYIEDHTGMSQSFQAVVTSLVCEGVFEAFPDLQVVVIEGGFAWLAPLLWRLDRSWAKLGNEVPHLKRPPSESIREHLWITTQPMEEPNNPRHFHQVLDHLGMNDRIVFATDYPHWDFDAPDQAFPVRLAPDLERAIMGENAHRLYRLGAKR